MEDGFDGGERALQKRAVTWRRWLAMGHPSWKSLSCGLTRKQVDGMIKQRGPVCFRRGGDGEDSDKVLGR